MNARSTPIGQATPGGFSLIEVTVAIGIFAFVAVGILGLMPTALRLRSDSAQETRAVMIAEELFSSVASAESLNKVVLRDGPGLQPRNNQEVDLTKDQVLLGYPPQTTIPYGLWHSARGSDPIAVWSNGVTDSWAVDNDIQTLALLRATNVAGFTNLFRVTCEVRAPAALPSVKSSPSVFFTYFPAQ